MSSTTEKQRGAVLAFFALSLTVVLGAGVATAQTEWTDYPQNPVIGPGPQGSWDPMRIVFAVHFDGAVHHRESRNRRRRR